MCNKVLQNASANWCGSRDCLKKYYGPRGYAQRLRSRRNWYRKYGILVPIHKKPLQVVIEKFGAKCYVCESESFLKNGKLVPTLDLHHRWYDYTSGDSTNQRRLEALANPEQFVQICKRCHIIITKLHREFHKKQLAKLFQLAREIRGEQYRMRQREDSREVLSQRELTKREIEEVLEGGGVLPDYSQFRTRRKKSDFGYADGL